MPRRRQIRSANAEFQLLLALLENRRQRHRQGRFLVEGVRAIDAAVENGWPIEAMLSAEGTTLSRWAAERTAEAQEWIELAPALMGQLSGKEETSELLAVMAIPPDDLERIPPRESALLVVLDRPASPGNLGSIVRTAEALGADGVVVVGHAADPYDPQAVRATQGALFALPVVRVDSPEDVTPWLERRGLRVVGTSARGDVPVDEADLEPPLALVFGNETKGLSWGWRERCDLLVRIPQAGSASSLNLAAAAAIALYEASRRRAAPAA